MESVKIVRSTEWRAAGMLQDVDLDVVAKVADGVHRGVLHFGDIAEFTLYNAIEESETKFGTKSRPKSTESGIQSGTR